MMTTNNFSQRTQKPALYGRHWMAVTGKPLAATAGAMIFQKGGNAVDAAAAMIAATCTMWDTLSLGRRDAGADLQPAHEKGHRHQRPRRRSDRRHRRILQEQGNAASARIRPARRRHARNARRHHVMLAEYGKLS